MYELFVKIKNLTLSFGLFTTENIDKAIEILTKEYPNCLIYPEPVEVDVLRIHKANKPFRMWNLNE